MEYFDELDEQAHARVSLGQAVLAMVLNGLGLEPPPPVSHPSVCDSLHETVASR